MELGKGPIDRSSADTIVGLVLADLTCGTVQIGRTAKASITGKVIGAMLGGDYFQSVTSLVDGRGKL